MRDSLDMVRFAIRLAVDDGFRANEISAAVWVEFQAALKANALMRRDEKRSSRSARIAA